MSTMVSLKISTLQKLLESDCKTVYKNERMIQFASGNDCSPARYKRFMGSLNMEYDPTICNEVVSGVFLYKVEREKEVTQLNKDMYLVSLLGGESLIVDVELVRYLRER